MMKQRWIIIVGFTTLVIAGAAFLFFSRDPAQRALEETRRALRQQGLKIDLAEFAFSTSPERRARAAALTMAGRGGPPSHPDESAHRAGLMQDRLDLMSVVGSNAALVVWKQAKLPPRPNPDYWVQRKRFEEDVWPELREILNEDRAGLDRACEAALSGPIRFELAASRGTAMSLPHLAALRHLAQLLGTRATLELHDGNQDAAWTNLLACTRLITAWDPEPCEISHLVQFVCTIFVYNATWQALQADGWADDRLALLQREWESVDFFHGLPETEAFARACAADSCQSDRREPLGPSFILQELFRSPLNAWHGFTQHWSQIWYRHHGSYEDERALLLYYRDRELQVRRALRCATWSEMRPLPGATNMVPILVPLQAGYQTRLISTLDRMAMQLRIMSQGQGLLGLAAEAEARRRILIAAIALERYRGRHGSYPQVLQELVPELLQSTPIDFMDGKPLRYRLTADGHFVLYSVGLNCVDDGGTLLRRERRESSGGLLLPGPRQATHLVWPHPASTAEIQAQKEEEEKQSERERAALQERQTKAER